MKTPFLTTSQKLCLAILAVSMAAVHNVSAVMVTWAGTNGISATTNWSDANNWFQINTTTHISPANNAANFTFWTAMPTAGLITVNVDGAYGTPGTGPAQSYGGFFGQTNGFHTVLIQPGITWLVQAQAGTPGVGIMVSPQITNNNTISSGTTYPSIPYTNYTTIEGLGGTLALNGPGLRVEAGSTVVDNHYSILDMSGLGTFTMTNVTAAASDFFYVVNGSSNSQGLVYLAMTNVINIYDSVQIGYLGSFSNSLPIGVYLGQSNYIATGAGNNNMIIGYTGCSNGFLKFNPSLLGGPAKPTAFFTGSGGSQNVMICNGNNGKVPASAICDLTGGNVTWQANTMSIGVSGASGVSANGVLTFDNGTVSASTVVLGSQPNSAGAAGVGTINIGTNATFQVSGYMVMGTNTGTLTAGTAGVLNLTNGTLVANTISNAAGTGTINMTNANWSVALASTSATNINVTSFNAVGPTNIINITSITPFLGGSLPVRFHLIAGTISGASTLGVVLPASYNPSYPYGGYLDYTSNPNLVDLVLTSAPPSAVVLTWTGTNAGVPDGNWDVSSTPDWLASGVASTYIQYDLATFNDIPSPAQTNVNLTTTLTPYSITVNNAASLYTFSGSGSLGGATGLTKQGTGTLILDNTTSNSFTGGVTINGGILQIGTNDASGSLPIGPVTDNSILAFDQDVNEVVGNNISGSGTVVAAGGTVVQLTGANSFTGNAIATNNSTLKGGVANAFGAASGKVLIASGSTLDGNGAGTSRGVIVSGAGVGGNGAIINSSTTVIGDSGAGIAPSIALSNNTTFGYPTRWDLGSSTGATLSTGGQAYNLNMIGNGTNYWEWRDVAADSNLANINISAGFFGVAGSTTVGNPSGFLTVPAQCGLKFYSDDGFNASINKQVVINDLGLIQNGSGASTMNGGLNITNSGGFQYCQFEIGGTSLTVNSAVTGNGILYMQGGTSPLILNGNGSAFTGGVYVSAGVGTFTLNGSLGAGITNDEGSATLSGSGMTTGYVDWAGNFYPGGNGSAGTFTTGGLTLESGADLTMDLSSTLAVGGGTNDLIVVNGNVSGNNNIIYINPFAGTLANGTYTLMTYTGTLSTPFASAQMVSASRYTLTLGNPSGEIQLTVTGNPNNLVWNNGQNNSQWDVVLSKDWTNLTADDEDYFYTSDAVTFDDTISAAPNPATNINVLQTVYPSTVTVNATNNNYTFGGTGQISGGASILKEGASTLVINTTNSFVGPVTVSGGIVQAGNVSALGAATGTVTVTNGGTLDLKGNAITGKSYFVAGTGAGGNGAIINSGSAIDDNPGSLTNITMLGDTTFGGPTRWDFGNRTGAISTLSTGGNPYNLTLTNSSVGTYTWEWYDIAADTNLNNINLEIGQWGVISSTLGNPSAAVTIYPGAEMVFYGGSGFAKNYLLMTNGEIQINAGGPVFNFTMTMDAGSIFSTAVAAQVTGPTLLQGLASFNIVGSATFSNVISGTGGINMIDSDTSALVLAATNTYTGPTLLTGSGTTLELLGNGSISGSTNIDLTTGTFLVASTRVDGTLTLASGQTLQGSGTVRGSLLADAGSTVSPGLNGTGTLTVTNAVSLGGTTAMGIGTGSNNLLSGVSITYAGTLSLSFVPGSISATNTYKLFNSSAANYGGSFASITPSTPGPGLEWNTSQLDASGTLGVIPTPVPATFGPSHLSGTNLTLAGTGGTSNGTYRVFTTTNIATPLSNWVQVGGTGMFDSNGNFNFNTAATNAAAQFYILKEP